MTLNQFIGSYERKLDPKNRLNVPAPWSAALHKYKEFYLYQAHGTDFLSVISKSHLEENRFKMSPLECNGENSYQFIAQHIPKYGPVLVGQSIMKKLHKFTIKKGTPFIDDIREDRKVTVVGGLDYFLMFHGTVEDLMQRGRN
ncbi:hypothetical protein HOA92_02980 [archaeon]|jgi:hypothetical protein|nr:hypothetical protein [archaeon]MBT6761979.1 hypothetical protein [archaeon]